MSSAQSFGVKLPHRAVQRSHARDERRDRTSGPARTSTVCTSIALRHATKNDALNRPRLTRRFNLLADSSIPTLLSLSDRSSYVSLRAFFSRTKYSTANRSNSSHTSDGGTNLPVRDRSLLIVSAYYNAPKPAFYPIGHIRLVFFILAEQVPIFKEGKLLLRCKGAPVARATATTSGSAPGLLMRFSADGTKIGHSATMGRLP